MGQFVLSIHGKKIAHILRRGKYIIMEFSDHSALLFHLRMTGQLLINHLKNNARAWIQFDNGLRLSFVDRRRFGEIQYSADWRKEKCIQNLGIEPLGGNLTAEYLRKNLRGRSASIHSLLLNQKMIGGIGNIYAAEALFSVGIRPQRKGKSLGASERDRLIHAIKHVLKDSIRHRGYSMNTYVDVIGKKGKTQLFTKVYGKDGLPCPVCSQILKKIKISGRSAVYCPQCQR